MSSSANPPGQIVRAMLLMGGAISLFPAGDVISKHLAQSYPLVEVVWARYLVHFLVMVVALGGPRAFRRFGTRHLGLQLARVVLAVLSTLAFIGALKHIALAEAITFLFANPLFVVALSVPLLGERVGIHRWAAVVIGFAGVVVVFQPDRGLFQWGALLALFSGLAVALLHISARVLSRTDHPVTTVLYMAGGGTLVLGLAVPFDWITPSATDLGLMLLSGIFASLGHLGVLTAIRMAPVSALAPVTYTQIVTATALGYAVFGEVPGASTLAGLAVIVGSGLYVLHRERRTAARAADGGA